MAYFTGTLLASPVVNGSSGDTYGTHHSVLGVGGFQEFDTITDRNNIPVGGSLEYDGISSGRRRLGMIVYVHDVDTTYQLKINKSTWDSYNDTQKVDALANNNNWEEFQLGAGTGSGERIEKSYTQTSHGFEVGDVIGWNNDTMEFEKVLAVIGANEALGIVSEVPSTSGFTICFGGYFEGISGGTTEGGGSFQGGETYFLSPDSAGKLTTTEPTQIGDVTKPILVTLTSNSGVVVNYRGAIISESLSGETGQTVSWNDVVNKPFLFTGATNVGGGAEVFSGATSQGNTIFRTLSAGTNMTITTSGDTIIFESATVPDIVENLGDGIGLFSGVTGVTRFFRSLVPSGNTQISISTDGEEVIINSIGITGGTELGTGNNVFAGINDKNIEFKSINNSGQDDFINVNATATNIIFTIGDEVFTGATTLGTGSSLIGSASGNDLQLRSITGSGNTSVQLSGNTLVISSDGITGVTNVGIGVGEVFSGKTGDAIFLRTISGATGVNVSNVDSTIVIEGINFLTGGTNIGGASGELVSSKSGQTLQVRTLSGTSGVDISTIGDVVEVSGQNFITGATTIAGGEDIIQSISGQSIQLKSLSGGTNTLIQTVGDTIVISSVDIISENIGQGVGVFSGQTGNTEFFRTLTGISGIDVYASGGTIFISGENVNINNENIGIGENIFSGASGTTQLFKRIAGSGETVVFTSGNTIYVAYTGTTGSVSNVQNIGSGDGEIFSGTSGNTILLRTIEAGTNITITSTGDTILISAASGTTQIGPAEDGTYADGLFSDFTNTTPVGTPIDRFNELFKLLVPQPAPELDQLSRTSTIAATVAKLSWGGSRNDIGYENVTNDAGGTTVDINGIYQQGNNRQGLVNGASVSGVLNDDVSGTGIPYNANAFGDADTGAIVVELNGNIVETISLSATTAATSGSYVSLSQAFPVKFDNGNDFNFFLYRTGTYSVSAGQMQTGFNYIKIIHSASTFTRQTNYLEWVYDNDTSNITLISSQITTVNLTGSRNISGVEYYTGGDITYTATTANVYKNVYSNSTTAISFPSRINLGDITSMDVVGIGIINRLSSTSKTLPELRTDIANPESQDIEITANLPIGPNVQSNRVLGSVGNLGTLRTNLNIIHPFTSKSMNVQLNSLTGFLIYNITQANDENNENFTGEVRRLETRDYSTLNYVDIDGGDYEWNGSADLISSNPQHQTGMLVFNGELMYPNATYLGTQYGITSGNFNALANSPVGNANYTSASGERNYFRNFKSANAGSLSQINIRITHTGTVSDFLTGNVGGTPTGNQIRFEFLIIKTDNTKIGWTNPFNPSSDSFGIARLGNAQQNGSVTEVTATLGTNRIDNNDLVILRMYFSSNYSNRISNIEITNI